MNRIKLILVLVILAILILVSVFFYGRYQGKNSARLENRPAVVNSQLILDRITDQYFLVTKTVFIDSQVEIETPKNNDWTDLFTGKKITVLGLVRVDVGLDMNNMRPENIIVNHQEETVFINLPHAEVLNSSLSGEINFAVDRSIVERLKNILKSTQNDDYNLALQTLIDSADSQVKSNEDIFISAREDSAKLIDLIVSSMLPDYQIVIQ